MRVVLLGTPGAGKGTQCKFIVDKYGLLHLSSGDILRRHRAEGSDLGRQAQSYMDSGALVPDELIVEMMIDEIGGAPKSGYVLDGFPRTLNQAVKLDELLARSREKIDIVLNLKAAEDVIIKRVTGRRSCPKCGAVYHIENMKPKVNGICDHDGTVLVQRPDDTAEVVSSRLKNYYEQSAPLVDYYKEKNSFYEFNADGNARVVREKLFEKLDALV